MSTAAQIDLAIRKTADKSARLGDTIQELTLEVARIIQDEGGGASSLSDFKLAGDIVAGVVENIPAMIAEASKATKRPVDASDITRDIVDGFIRSPAMLDSIANLVTSAARRSQRAPDYAMPGGDV